MVNVTRSVLGSHPRRAGTEAGAAPLPVPTREPQGLRAPCRRDGFEGDKRFQSDTTGTTLRVPRLSVCSLRHPPEASLTAGPLRPPPAPLTGGGRSAHLLAPCTPQDHALWGTHGGDADPRRGEADTARAAETRRAQRTAGAGTGRAGPGGGVGGAWRALRVFAADVTIAAGASPYPVAADRGWFELVRRHSDAGCPIYRSAAAVAKLCQPRRPCSLRRPRSSSGGRAPPARLLAPRPARRRRRGGSERGERPPRLDSSSRHRCLRRGEVRRAAGRAAEGRRGRGRKPEPAGAEPRVCGAAAKRAGLGRRLPPPGTGPACLLPRPGNPQLRRGGCERGQAGLPGEALAVPAGSGGGERSAGLFRGGERLERRSGRPCSPSGGALLHSAAARPRPEAGTRLCRGAPAPPRVSGVAGRAAGGGCDKGVPPERTGGVGCPAAR